MLIENKDITIMEYDAYKLSLESIIKTASRGLRYGPDMASSMAACLDDVRIMANRGIGITEYPEVRIDR